MSGWDVIVAHVEHNWEIYTAAASAITIAAICCWPEKIPASAQDWWTWARSTFQMAVPAARAHAQQQEPTQNPTQPATPAQPNPK